MKATTRTPQAWLPVGQQIHISSHDAFVPTPVSYDADGKPIAHREGTIVEHLARGGVVVKFENYPNTWDYTDREAAGFERVTFW